MSPAEAAQLLDVPEAASLEQVEARFLELRTKLEDKIARAPTPGLQTKYRETLAAITEAHEVLLQASGGGDLPVLRREQAAGSKEKGRGMEAGDRRPEAGGVSPSPSSLSPDPAPRRNSGVMYVVVAILVVAALAAGGWWYAQQRAQQAEAARVVAEQARLEQERQAAAERERVAAAEREAERRRQAETEAKRAAEAEKERRQRLEVDLRRELVAARAAWNAFELEVWNASRAATDARTEARDLRDASPAESGRAAARAAAAEDFAAWMSRQATAGPLRPALERFDALLRGGDVDAAAVAAQELKTEQESLARQMEEARASILTLTGSIELTASPGDFDWELTDAFGEVQRGRTPATITGVAAGRAVVRLSREGWPARERSVTVRRNESLKLSVDQPVGAVELAVAPAGTSFRLVDAIQRRFEGVTPATLPQVAAGEARLELSYEGWPAGPETVAVSDGQTVAFRRQIAVGSLAVASEPAGAEVYVGERRLGVTPLTLPAVPVGRHELQLRKADFKPATVSAQVAAGATASVRAELASALGLENYPVVWFFRYKRVLGLALKFQVTLNGQPVMRVTNGSYGVFRVRPGRYQLEVDPSVGSNLSRTLEFAPNRTYYYRLAPPTEFKLSPPPFFEETTEQAARSELHELSGTATPQLLSITPLP